MDQLDQTFTALTKSNEHLSHQLDIINKGNHRDHHGAILGILIGTFTFRYLSEDTIRILIGVIAVVFCFNYRKKKLVMRSRKAKIFLQMQPRLVLTLRSPLYL